MTSALSNVRMTTANIQIFSVSVRCVESLASKADMEKYRVAKIGAKVAIQYLFDVALTECGNLGVYFLPFH